jgi:ABC-type uncharacterized transport system substrate-binding protein
LNRPGGNVTGISNIAVGLAAKRLGLLQLVQRKADALLVTDNTLFNNWREELVALAARHTVPTIYTFPEFATAGGLISYAPSLREAYRQAGIYTGRILKGTKPAELPVLQPTRLDFRRAFNETKVSTTTEAIRRRRGRVSALVLSLIV